MSKSEKKPKKKGVSYGKWGYIFSLPFIVVYLPASAAGAFFRQPA